MSRVNIFKIALTSTFGLAALAVPSVDAAGTYPEIHCKHFFYGYPAGTPATNDLIIRDDYALSSNDETKFADWVAYRLDCATVCGEVPQERKWMTDPWLDEEETLEAKPDDYAGASDALDVDRGHQAPLASFKGTFDWWETNYYSNITPQKSDLNQGPWVKIEEMERKLARAGNVVYVMTGPLYERDMPPLPNCDEPHRVPSGYWKVIAIQPEDSYNSIRVITFVFDQGTPRDADPQDYPVTVDEVEERTRLDFMWELPEDIEVGVESSGFGEWAESFFE